MSTQQYEYPNTKTASAAAVAWEEMGNFLGVSTLVLKGIDEAVEVPEAIAKPRRVIAS